ncbi:MAG: metal-binding protein [Candidatus Bipolaricaulota bacterium]|nr:metal-binding protein [Candidatus Bipolaricaulota bacterium]MDW8141071.1 metal-binding protein [Candidatus Bipolaricaulota bacterium]
MPAGTTHLRIELITLPLWIALFYLFIDTSWLSVALFGGAYLFSSLFLSPDLDLRHNAARRRWGLLGFIWLPYTKVFKHRGVSHSLLFGTLTRLGYLALLAVLIGFALSYWNVWNPSATRLPWTKLDLGVVGVLLAGLWLPNILHALVDRVDSLLPRRRRRYRAYR